MTMEEMQVKKELVMEWCIAHHFPCKIIDDKKVLWQTKIQTGEYDSENDSTTWHNREYFLKK